MLKRRLFVIFAVVVIAGYLVANRADWVTVAAKRQGSRNPLFSHSFDLSHKGSFAWNVLAEQWPHESGTADLYLDLNLGSLREIPRDRSRVELRAKVSAHRVRPDGGSVDCVLKDDYFKTDEPFSKEGWGLGEYSGSGHTGFLLAGLEPRLGEDLIIEFTVQEPDPQLASGNPRLKLVSGAGLAGVDQLLLPLGNDLWLGAALLLLVILAYRCWPPSATPKMAVGST